MRNKLLYAVLAAAIFGASFAAAYAYAPYQADRLKKGAVFCRSAVDMIEAVRAGDDLRWIDSIPTCVRTNHTLQVRVIDCRSGRCDIRFFDALTDDGQGVTGTGYVRRSDLYKS